MKGRSFLALASARALAAATQVLASVMVLAKRQAASGFLAPLGTAQALPVTKVSGLPWRSLNGATVISTSGEASASTLRYQSSIGKAPSWSLANWFLAPKKSKLSRRLLSLPQPPLAWTIPAVVVSASTTLGSFSWAVLPSSLSRAPPLALTQRGRNSGILGSKPIRLSLPPSVTVNFSAMPASLDQSVVSTSAGLSPASRTALLPIIITRTE